MSFCKKDRDARIRWLVDHQYLWNDWPTARRDYTPELLERQKEIIGLMTEAGLYSPNSEISIFGNIQRARKLRDSVNRDNETVAATGT